MNIPIEELEQASENRNRAIQKLDEAIRQFAERLALACNLEERIILTNDRGKIVFINSPRVIFEGRFKNGKRFTISWCTNKLEDFLLFAKIITPEMLSGMIKKIESDTSRLEEATKVLENQ